MERREKTADVSSKASSIMMRGHRITPSRFLIVVVLVGSTIVSIFFGTKIPSHPANKEQSETRLERAIFDHDLVRVKALVKADYDLQEHIRCGTALDLAVAERDKPIAEFLLEHGAMHTDPVHTAIAKHDLQASIRACVERLCFDRSWNDGMADTDLHVAVFWHNVPAAMVLLAANKDSANSSGAHGETPIKVAVGNSDEEMIDLLLKNGADEDLAFKSSPREIWMSSAIELACQMSKKNIVDRLVDHKPYHRLIRNVYKRPANDYLLGIAAFAGNVGAMTSLLEHGANPNGRSGHWNGFRPTLGEWDTQPLIDALEGCLPQSSTFGPMKTGGVCDWWPLYLFSKKYHRNAAVFLLQHGAKVGPTAYDQAVALQTATSSYKDDVELVEELCKHGLTPTTGLLLSLNPGDRKIAMLMIRLGGDVNAHDYAGGGHTPLSYAVHAGDLELAKLLLEHGADPNAKNADGSPMFRPDFCPEKNKKKMTDLLTAHGMKISDY